MSLSAYQNTKLHTQKTVITLWQIISLQIPWFLRFRTNKIHWRGQYPRLISQREMIDKLNTMRPWALTDDFLFKPFLCCLQYSVDSLYCCIFLSILLLWQVIFPLSYNNVRKHVSMDSNSCIVNEIHGKLIKIGIHLFVLYSLKKALWLK